MSLYWMSLCRMSLCWVLAPSLTWECMTVRLWVSVSKNALSVTMLSVLMLSVARLNVIMMNAQISIAYRRLWWMSLCCVSYPECRFPEYRSSIHNTSFSLSVTNTPKKLECYMTLGWKGFPGTNTLTSWAQIQFFSHDTDALRTIVRYSLEVFWILT